METKIISTWWNVEQNRQPEMQTPTPWLEKDVGVVRGELEEIIEAWVDKSAGKIFADSHNETLKKALNILHTNKPPIRKEFTETAAKQAFNIFKTIWGKEETAVWIYADDVNEEKISFGRVIELDSAKRWATSVQYSPEELLEDKEWMVSVWNGHNHLIGKDVTKMKSGEETSVQWKSDTDINSDKDLSDQVKQSGDIEQNHFTSMLSMPYEYEWQLYWSVAITGLTSSKGERETFEYQWKTCHQLIQCPDGSIKDIMELPQDLAARILQNRLLAIDSDEENVKVAA